VVAERKAFPLRLRADAYEALRRWADDDLRSMNGQIEFLILQALRETGRLREGGKSTPGSRDKRGPDQSRS
jgi:hypothetical protein